MSESTDTEQEMESTEDSNLEGKDASPESDETAERDGGPRKRKRRRGARPMAPPDEQSEKALQFVTDVLADMEMDCTVQLRRPREEDDRDIRLEVAGADSARVIGKRGQVLGALQFLTNRVLNRPGEERRYVTVDAEGYRSRRDNSLAAMAKRLGKQAINDGKIITFEPMPPRDRRLVHLALAKFDGVITKSDGEGDERRVQIIPVRRST